MDSPHLWHLAFLLLALAAPHPSIAMSMVGPAEGKEDYSTDVTVYFCKGCNSCKCRNLQNDFEEFEKIAATQNKIFSDGIIELETNRTHTTVCFEEPSFCIKGRYGILWQRAGGSGLACGILNSGENHTGDISTEKNNICCEAETDNKKYNPTLKCFYTQKSHPKLTTPPAGIPGNPEFLTSKKSSTGILFAFLFVGVCIGWGTMYYCLRLRRGQALRQDRQSPDRENLALDG